MPGPAPVDRTTAPQNPATRRAARPRFWAFPQVRHWPLWGALLCAAVLALGVAAGQDVRLSFSDDGGQPLARIDRNSLRRAVLALADNALAHTGSGGSIIIRTGTEGKQAVVCVADTGSGITDVDQARIFDRFVRTSGPEGIGGQRSFGIGLALVREIATAAGGSVEIDRTGPSGTTMKLRLPLARRCELAAVPQAACGAGKLTPDALVARAGARATNGGYQCVVTCRRRRAGRLPAVGGVPRFPGLRLPR